MANLSALILAGGRGKRMDIFCQWRPKPVLPFGGRYRVIDFSLNNCIHSGIRSVGILMDYRRDEIAEYSRKWQWANKNAGDLTLLQPQSGSFSGTADAVYKNLEYLDNQDAEAVLILAGDHIYSMDYRKMYETHKSTKADVTVGIVKVPTEQALRFGTVEIDAERRIHKFVEKSPEPCSNYASMGIYIFNKSGLTERLAEDAVKINSLHDFGYSILPAMVERRDRVFAYEYTGYWRDIGTMEAYYQANRELLDKESRINRETNWMTRSGDDDKQGYKLGENGSIVNSIISPGCVINGYVENSILSPGVQVDERAEIHDSIIMAETRIGYHSVVRKCIIDEGVKVGKFCYVGFGGGSDGDNQEITLLGRNVEVPPNTAVGRKAKIMPNVGPAELASHLVPSGSTVFCLEPG